MKRLVYIVLWLLSLAGAYTTGIRNREMREVTLVRRDTVRIVRPEVMVIHTRGTTAERLPLTGSDDSADVEIPLQQAVYADSSYTAYVSGYRPRLDSLVFVRTETFAPLPRRAESLRRWSIGIQAGYGITPRGPQPYLGLGISFRIF